MCPGRGAHWPSRQPAAYRAARRRAMRMGAAVAGRRERHGGAWPRRALFAANIGGLGGHLRHHAACRRGAVFPDAVHGWTCSPPREAAARGGREHRPTRTQRVPGRAVTRTLRAGSRVWSRTRPHGGKHRGGPAAERIDETNDTGHAGGASDPTIIPDANAASRAPGGYLL